MSSSNNPPTGGVPVGTIMAYAGYVDDSSVQTYLQSIGWLYCNGDQFDNTQWPDLVAVINNAWGGDGVATWYLPDLRGYFLRGVDDTAGSVDPDATTRMPSNPNLTSNQGNQGNTVGSLQEDSVGPLTSSTTTIYSDYDGNDTVYGGYGMGYVVGGNTWVNGNVQGTLNPALSTGAESRPKNKYVYFIIYAGTQVTTS